MPLKMIKVRSIIASIAVVVVLASLPVLQIYLKRNVRQQREQSLRTIKDWAIAWETYCGKTRTYLPPNEEIARSGWGNIKADQLIKMFSEAGIDNQYSKRLHPRDGWGWNIQFAIFENEGRTEYSIRSPGKDGKWDNEQYEPNTPTRLYDNDIVLSCGQFVQYPSTCPSSPPFPFEDETWAWPLIKAKSATEK